ncbi:hypothetical protein KUL42_42550 [Alteromonas sp. KUL42]|uniref:DUF2271 domain-containing protein n=1 Tax=Alteromonas sp. KUL42 TaxID=2480797 RepID=UPI001035AF06|nr:DUF2271 domain-containing protein [Alteromonas sp. KUL42]TAP30976.1 DUF2271 domain-containing protein [Alteromonas sp. KUL42]GEA09494.1 hypothetical protein KUL42_42550 [Alteromonas sp. KUL42]
MKVKKGSIFTSAFWGLALFAGATQAADQMSSKIALDVTLPQLNVAEYHKPYLAVWIEDNKRKATQVAVWYDVEMREDKGKEWLKDLRQWWRRGGRSLDLPYDGLTSATKGPGDYTLDTQLNTALANLPDGEYTLRVEASREVGGREVLSLPFALPLSANSLPIEKIGKSELGRVAMRLED